MQPYTGNQMLMVEKRNSRGGLDLSEPQPTISSCTFDHLYEMMFRECPLAVGTWDNLRAWLGEKGWQIRPKTW